MELHIAGRMVPKLHEFAEADQQLWSGEDPFVLDYEPSQATYTSTLLLTQHPMIVELKSKIVNLRKDKKLRNAFKQHKRIKFKSK